MDLEVQKMKLDIPDDRRPRQTRADITRKLMDEWGYTMIEAHEAVTQGKVPAKLRI